MPSKMKKALALVEKRRTEAESNKPVQQELPLILPPWSLDRRAMPKDWAQSAMFVLHDKRKPRLQFTNHPVFKLGGGRMTYTGQELREEDDKLVWLQAVQFAKQFPVGDWVEFKFYDMVKALKWPNSSFYYHKAHECLLRMFASAVTMDTQKLGEMEAVSFIKEYKFDTKEQGGLGTFARVRLDERMVALFSNDWTEVTWDAYLSLSALARRIYDYASCHREPHAQSLEKIRLMTGSENDARERRWAEAVRKAAAELKEKGMVDAEVINGRLVFHTGRLK